VRHPRAAVHNSRLQTQIPFGNDKPKGFPFGNDKPKGFPSEMTSQKAFPSEMTSQKAVTLTAFRAFDTLSSFDTFHAVHTFHACGAFEACDAFDTVEACAQFVQLGADGGELFGECCDGAGSCR
jgi:hypothetical protein